MCRFVRCKTVWRMGGVLMRHGLRACGMSEGHVPLNREREAYLCPFCVYSDQDSCGIQLLYRRCGNSPLERILCFDRLRQLGAVSVKILVDYQSGYTNQKKHT